jgi:hypothetical protein
VVRERYHYLYRNAIEQYLCTCDPLIPWNVPFEESFRKEKQS